ncbi:hypothetical protein FAES_3960 [Fibrella aestuarina BUZ 2]|uniref:Uncharacterized protein n=1 Tax=Fibrella aestuarina BUZ 2 TaxID=1166018 RepID=I0KCW0_9BACT|nr:hypothetical protein [Fibrella aestuarina]CCH01963.1 hypothetical protein FAES_3960 [Fibrella aestuarina BUZ 2]
MVYVVQQAPDMPGVLLASKQFKDFDIKPLEFTPPEVNIDDFDADLDDWGVDIDEEPPKPPNKEHDIEDRQQLIDSLSAYLF